MYGEMQEFGLTEIILLMYTSALYGLFSVFSHPEFLWGAPLEWLQSRVV